MPAASGDLGRARRTPPSQPRNAGHCQQPVAVEVPLQTMTHAYAAFANEGRQYDMVMIREIEDKFNKKILLLKTNITACLLRYRQKHRKN